MPTIQELREKRVKLVKDARTLADAAGKAKRDLTATENEQVDKIFAEVDRIAGDISSLEASEQRAARLAALELELAEPEKRKTAPESPDDPDPRANPKSFRWRRRDGTERVIEHRSSLPTESDDFRRQFSAYVRGQKRFEELRAMSAGSAVDGGFVIVPMQLSSTILQAVDNAVYLRGLATIFTIERAESLGVPSVESDPSDPDWTGEITQVTESTAERMGRRELNPSMLSKEVVASMKFLDLALIDVEAWVAERLGYKFSVAMERGYMLGTGANQPLGLFVPSSSGISTARDVSSGNTSSAVTGDGLISAKYALKSQYQASPTLRWIFHRDVVAQIRKLKDSQGQYLWQPGISADRPDRILDTPYIMSEYAPNALTTGAYAGIIGDMRFYWIADRAQFAIQRLNELRARTNQVSWIGRAQSDGMPALEEAFARVTLT